MAEKLTNYDPAEDLVSFSSRTEAIGDNNAEEQIPGAGAPPQAVAHISESGAPGLASKTWDRYQSDYFGDQEASNGLSSGPIFPKLIVTVASSSSSPSAVFNVRIMQVTTITSASELIRAS